MGGEDLSNADIDTLAQLQDVLHPPGATEHLSIQVYINQQSTHPSPASIELIVVDNNLDSRQPIRLRSNI